MNPKSYLYKSITLLIIILIFSSQKHVRAASSTVIINEIRSGSGSSAPNLATGEWVELYVAASVNITDWALSDQDGSNKGGSCGGASGDLNDCNYFFPQVGGSDCNLTAGSYIIVLTGQAPGTGTGWLPEPPGTAPAGDVCNPGGVSYFFMGNPTSGSGSGPIWNNSGDDVVLYQPTSQLDVSDPFKSCLTGMQDGNGGASSLEPYVVIDYIEYGSGGGLDLPPGAGGTHGVSGTCPTITWSSNPSAPSATETLSLNPNGTDGDSGSDWEISNGTTTVNDTNTATGVSGYDGGGSPGYDNTDFAFTPVTLSYFRATSNSKEVVFEWSTAMETGNMGFNLYVANKNGLQKINKSMILSQEISTSQASDYEYVANISDGDFYIEDIDIFGHTKRRGPFVLGQAYGARAVEIPVDWAAIAAEHKGKAAERQAETAVSAQSHTQQALANNNSSGPLMTLGVSQTGLQRVTYADLLAAGLDLNGATLANMALVNQGNPVEISVVGNGGLFGAGGYIEFYGQALDTLYTKENVYILHLDSTLAARATQNDSAPSGTPPSYYMESISLGDDNKYDVAASGGSPWYDTRLVAYNNPATHSYSINVDNYAAGTVPATLTVNMWGGTLLPQNPDHHAVIDFGGTTVGDEYFDGLVAHPVALALADGLVQNGNNTLQIRLPDDLGVLWDVVGVDSYGLTYPRSFVAKSNGQLTFTAVSDAFQVDGLPDAGVVVYKYDADSGNLTQLTNVAVSGSAGNYTASFTGDSSEMTYLVYSETHLLTPTLATKRPLTDITTTPADYLIISHADFINDLTPLITFHEGNGLTVKIVDVADVYDQFGNGIFDPQAIKDYLQFAEADMGIEYVLLVGGDTYDYFDSLGLGSISFIPSPYIGTGSIVNFAPVDPLLADVDGDLSPDLKLGRFPVRTSAELVAMIDKTLIYAEADYKETAVFSADILAERSFKDMSSTFSSLLPNNWQIDTAYLDETDVATAQSTLIDSMNGGVGLTSYVGHSGVNQWTWQGLFDANDAGGLNNVGQPTAVAQWGCWNTYHVLPQYNTLSHQFMQGDTGAAVVLGATTLTDADNENLLGQAFMGYLTQADISIGDALQLAKADLQDSSPGLLDVQLGYTLLGDPALSITTNSCAPAPTPTNVTLAQNGNNLELGWDDMGADHYEVWSSPDDGYYFMPSNNCAADAACTVVNGTSYTYSNAIQNQAYVVLAVNGCGAASPAVSARRVGIFHFIIQPGTF